MNWQVVHDDSFGMSFLGSIVTLKEFCPRKSVDVKDLGTRSSTNPANNLMEVTRWVIARFHQGIKSLHYQLRAMESHDCAAGRHGERQG